MPKFLIDENLSPLLSGYLRTLKYNSLSAREAGLRGKSDEEIIKWAQKNKRVIISSDLDFGDFFYSKSMGKIGVIVLKSKFQSFKIFKEIIDYLHQEKILRSEKLKDSLIVAVKGKYRIRRYF